MTRPSSPKPKHALKALRRKSRAASSRRCSSGEADRFDTYLEVHAGAGGTESQDWAQMLLRMYTRWAEKHGFKIEYLEETPGEEAGIKSATIQISGPQRLWLAQDRSRRASSGADLAVRFQRAAAHVVFERCDFPGRRRQHQDRHRGIRRPHRYDALRRRGRPARQQDRIGGAADAHPDRGRGGLSGRALAAQESRASLGHAARASCTRSN